MKSKLPVTILIAVRNEAANIQRCLLATHRAERVIVVDSHSDDGTNAHARAGGAEVVEFEWQGDYPKKRQWALDNLDIQSRWILLLDADEVVPARLWDEIESAIGSPDAKDGYLIAKGFHFLGRRFRYGGFSHHAVLLIRNGSARFEQITACPEAGHDMEIHERLIVNGTIGSLSTPLIHEDFKGLQAYVDRHNSYSTWEAAVRFQYLTSGNYGNDTIVPRMFGNAQERRRFLKRVAVRIPAEPLLWFLFHFVIKVGFLEGRRGFIASILRAQYIQQVRAKLYELRLRSRKSDQESSVYEQEQRRAA